MSQIFFPDPQDVRAQQGRAAVIAEVSRGGDVSSPQQLAEAARQVLAAGADAVIVPTDSESTPQGGPADIRSRAVLEFCLPHKIAASRITDHSVAVGGSLAWSPPYMASLCAGLADLFAVCQAVEAPVLVRDWVLHPLQIVDAKEAGAAGLLGIVTSVTGNGTGSD